MYNSAICSTDPITCFNLFGYSISHILSLILIRSVKHFVNDGENPDANLCNKHSRPMSESDPNKTAEYTSWASLTSDLDEPILRKAVQNILRVASYPWREIDTVPNVGWSTRDEFIAAGNAALSRLDTLQAVLMLLRIGAGWFRIRWRASFCLHEMSSCAQ